MEVKLNQTYYSVKNPKRKVIIRDILSERAVFGDFYQDNILQGSDLLPVSALKDRTLYTVKSPSNITK